MKHHCTAARFRDRCGLEPESHRSLQRWTCWPMERRGQSQRSREHLDESSSTKTEIMKNLRLKNLCGQLALALTFFLFSNGIGYAAKIGWHDQMSLLPGDGVDLK